MQYHSNFQNSHHYPKSPPLKKPATRIPTPPLHPSRIANRSSGIFNPTLKFGADCDYLPIYSLHLARYSECILSILTLNAKGYVLFEAPDIHKSIDSRNIKHLPEVYRRFLPIMQGIPFVHCHSLSYLTP